MECPVCFIIAFRVRNKWGIVKVEPQMTSERLSPKENISFKELWLLILQTGATFSSILWVKPQYTTPQSCHSWIFLHTSGFSQVAHLPTTQSVLSTDLGNCQVRNRKRDMISICRISEFCSHVQTILFTKDPVMFFSVGRKYVNREPLLYGGWAEDLAYWVVVYPLC